MGRPDDEVERAVAQRLESFRNRKQQIDRGIKSCFFKKTQLDGRDDGEVGVRNQIGDGDAQHGVSSATILGVLERLERLELLEPL